MGTSYGTYPNIIRNMKFDTSAGWILGTNWSIADGKAIYNDGGTNIGWNELRYPAMAVIGATYRLRFDVTVTTGRLNIVTLGPSNQGNAFIEDILTSRSVDSTITFSGIASPTGYLTFRAWGTTGGFIGSIDNVILQRIR